MKTALLKFTGTCSLIVILSGCFAYQPVLYSELDEGNRVKLDLVTGDYVKGRVIRISQETMWVKRDFQELEIRYDLIDTPRKRKFSVLKTSGMAVGVFFFSQLILLQK